MALHSHRSKDVPLPLDSVQLSRAEAVLFQRELLSNWIPKSDVRMIQYGSAVLAAASGLSGLYVNHFYRYKLRLLHYGRVSTYLPAVGFPILTAFFFHSKFVQDPLFIQEIRCPICLELRAAAVQCACAVLHPLVLAPLSSFIVASRYHTHNIPPNLKGVISTWKRFTYPMKQTFLLMTAVQAFIACCVTHLEGRSVIKVQEKLLEIEEEYEIQEHAREAALKSNT